jgi:hypothetical protein
MITVRNNKTNGTDEIWLQYNEGSKQAIGAIYCKRGEEPPDMSGFAFFPVSPGWDSGVFAESSDRLLTFDDRGKLIKNEPYQDEAAKVTKSIQVPESIEHNQQQFALNLWTKSGKARLYVKTPGGSNLGYWDLKSDEWNDADNYNFANKESEQAFVEKVKSIASTVKEQL